MCNNYDGPDGKLFEIIYIKSYSNISPSIKVRTCWLFQEEPGAHLEPTAGAESDPLNGVSGSVPSAALHLPAGPKKRRHRLARQEKDKDQHVGAALGHTDTFVLLYKYCAGVFVCLGARRLVSNTKRFNSSCSLISTAQET